MAAKNDVTSDTLKTKPSSEVYRNNYDKIFGKQQKSIEVAKQQMINSYKKAIENAGGNSDMFVDSIDTMTVGEMINHLAHNGIHSFLKNGNNFIILEKVMNNRHWNAKNPYQGDAERVLCVCSAGLLRSPTVANVMARHGYNTRAVGLEKEFALIPIDDVLFHWADSVVVMNLEQAEKIRKDFEGPIYNLSIPDEYEFMDSELIAIVESRLTRINDWLYTG